MTAQTLIEPGRVRTTSTAGRVTFDSDEQMFYTRNIVTAQILVPQRVRAYDNPYSGLIEVINNIEVADVDDGISFVGGSYKLTGSATKQNGVWFNFGSTAFIQWGRKVSQFYTSAHFLTPFVDSGKLYVRDHWVSPSNPGSNVIEYSGPFTVDMKMVLGGFN